MTALLFGILTVALAGPIPEALARASWPLHVPRAAMVLWQSIAVAAVLSAVSTGLAIAGHLLTPGPEPLTHLLAYTAGAIFTLVVGARLLFTAVRVGIRTRARRRVHRDLVDVVCAPAAPHRVGPGVRVLDVQAPLAYCLPGLRSRVVLSEGVLRRLDDPELTAVIEHERAHLRARHDLVLEGFLALHEAFPRFVRSRSALGSVQLLIEALADDRAIHTTGPIALGRALVACADATAPRGAMAMGGPTTLVRIQRLACAGDHRGISAVTYGLAAAILVVPTLAVVLPWLTELGVLAGSP